MNRTLWSLLEPTHSLSFFSGAKCEGSQRGTSWWRTDHDEISDPSSHGAGASPSPPNEFATAAEQPALLAARARRSRVSGYGSGAGDVIAGRWLSRWSIPAVHPGPPHSSKGNVNSKVLALGKLGGARRTRRCRGCSSGRRSLGSGKAGRRRTRAISMSRECVSRHPPGTAHQSRLGRGRRIESGTKHRLALPPAFWRVGLGRAIQRARSDRGSEARQWPGSGPH